MLLRLLQSVEAGQALAELAAGVGRAPVLGPPHRLRDLVGELQRPERLLEAPELWPSAVEELMRFESPVAEGYRKTLLHVEQASH